MDSIERIDLRHQYSDFKLYDETAGTQIEQSGAAL